MSQDKTRAKEATVQITKSGKRLSGSMLKIFNFRIEPEVEIQKPRTVGESRARGDLDVKGFNFSFQSYVSDKEWLALWSEIGKCDELGTPFPEISIAVTIAHRSGAPANFTLHGDLVMHLSPLERPEDGYVTHSWTGYCSYMDGK